MKSACHVLVVVAGLGLLGIAGCAEETGKIEGNLDTSKAPKSSQEAYDSMKNQGMYGGAKGAPGSGSPRPGGGAAPKAQP